MNNMKFINKLCILLSTIYIIWRLFTLPIHMGLQSICLASVFLIIEINDYLEFLVSYNNIILKIDKKAMIKQKKLDKFKDVDIIIATINEPISILKRTLDACCKIEYPIKELHVYVADDGNREEVKKLVESYNYGYITRTNNENAKAGNLNNAIKQTKSDYILFLDCDMEPKVNILNTMMPYFELYDDHGENEKIGFVQGPQKFVNIDIFQKAFNLKGKIPNDQNFFFNILQCTNSEINSVILCGTNVIIKREAINKIGGIATKSISEDFATGMLIENSGYRGIYVNKTVAIGYQETSLSGYIKQRTRWQRGCIQTGKKYKIFKQKGLRFNQKLQYRSAINYWYFGIKRFLFLIAPLMFWLFHIYLIKCSVKQLVLFWLPQYLIKRYLLDLNYSGNISSTWNKIYQTILMPVFLFTSILEFIGINKTKFEVSMKNVKVNRSKEKKYIVFLFIFHFILLLLNFGAFIYSILNITSEIFEIFTMLWSLSNTFYLTIALIFDISVNKSVNTENNEEVCQYSKMSVLEIFNKLKH